MRARGWVREKERDKREKEKQERKRKWRKNVRKVLDRSKSVRIEL